MPARSDARGALLAIFFAALSASAHAQAPQEPAETEWSMYVNVGLGRHRDNLGPIRGAAYGIDLRYRLWRHATLEMGCAQYRSGDGTAETALTLWRTTCGAAFGGGYRGRSFFAGGALGGDILLSTFALRYRDASTRTWSFRALGRADVSLFYVRDRARVGIRGRVRFAREYFDSRFEFSVGYAFAADRH